MGFRIATNVLSLQAQRNLAISQKSLGRALERLASGSRINRAGDDAAGLAISEGLGSAVRGYTQAIRNANDAIGFLNTAEGSLSNLTNITQRLRELAIQASTGTLGANDRSYLDTERNQLVQEFDRVAQQTYFNGVSLLDGTFATTALQVGIESQETISFTIGNARANSLGALASASGAQNVIAGSVTNLSINGTSIVQTTTADDTVSYANGSYSAIAIAKEINAQAGKTQVFADVKNTVQAFSLDFNSGINTTISGTNFQINGIGISGSAGTQGAFISLVNQYAAQTGVQARLQTGSNSVVELFATDGRNISLIFSTNAASNGFYNAFDAGNSIFLSTSLSGGGTFTAVGTINLRSASAITIAGTNTSLALGFSGTSVSINANSALNAITLGTQNSAQSALSTLDATLDQLSSLRASLGATQSRIDSTVSNLSVTVENLSSARSQVRDADVATETAELTKSQILQQAGVAVLGQANQSTQAALKLLNF